MRGAAHHSKMGSDMATREFGRQGGLVRGFLGVARHGGSAEVDLGRFPKVLRIAPESGDRESSNVPSTALEVLRHVGGSTASFPLATCSSRKVCG